MFQAQKLIAETHVANTRFAALLVWVSGVVAVLTSPANHLDANPACDSRKPLWRGRSPVYWRWDRSPGCRAPAPVQPAATNSRCLDDPGWLPWPRAVASG